MEDATTKDTVTEETVTTKAATEDAAAKYGVMVDTTTEDGPAGPGVDQQLKVGHYCPLETHPAVRAGVYVHRARVLHPRPAPRQNCVGCRTMWDDKKRMYSSTRNYVS